MGFNSISIWSIPGQVGSRTRRWGNLMHRLLIGCWWIDRIKCCSSFSGKRSSCLIDRSNLGQLACRGGGSRLLHPWWTSVRLFCPRVLLNLGHLSFAIVLNFPCFSLENSGFYSKMSRKLGPMRHLWAREEDSFLYTNYTNYFTIWTNAYPDQEIL